MDHDRLDAVRCRVREREGDPAWRARRDAYAAEVDAAILREQKAIRRLNLQRWRVPEAIWACLDAPRDTDAMIAARRFLADPSASSRFLVLAGPKGRGKTFTLSWSVATLGGRYYEAQELVQISTFDRLVWDDMAGAAILAVDELGAEQGNATFDANLYSVLNQRFRRQRKTVLATNLTWADFQRRYLAREGGLDRLAERLATGGRWVNLPGPSMREPGRP